MSAFASAVLVLVLIGRTLLESSPTLYAGLWIGLGATYLAVLVLLMLWVRSRRHQLREIFDPAQSEQAADFRLTPLFEYRSKLTLLGWPLIHIRLRGGLERGPVKAWIAAGDAAVGILFAFGAVAIAPVSFGGLSMGLVTVGGLAVGLLSFGGFSFAPWAIGAFAAGWQSYGACAVAWSAAQGVVAVAGDFASGAAALGRHANDSVAQAFFANSRFYQNVEVMMRYSPWLNLLFLLPLLLWWRHSKNGERRIES